MLSCLHQAPHAADSLGEACIPQGPEGAGPRLHGHWGRQGPAHFRLLRAGPMVASSSGQAAGALGFRTRHELKASAGAPTANTSVSACPCHRPPEHRAPGPARQPYPRQGQGTTIQ